MWRLGSPQNSFRWNDGVVAHAAPYILIIDSKKSRSPAEFEILYIEFSEYSFLTSGADLLCLSLHYIHLPLVTKLAIKRQTFLHPIAAISTRVL